MSGRPRRLAGFSYVGIQRYSLTFCSHRRLHVFTSPAVVDDAMEQIVKAAASHSFAGTAYCFMPDHLHLLVEARSGDADLRAFAHAVKQRTAYKYRQTRDGVLWQKGYYEHVVRDDERMLDAARYIVANPVRGGLVAEPRDYPFSGSLTFDRHQLDELWQTGRPGTP